MRPINRFPLSTSIQGCKLQGWRSWTVERETMLGAIAGDIIGSRFEGWVSVPADFDLFGTGCMFTDDTVCTIAVADAVINDLAFAENIRAFARRYPMRGYGESFHKWVTAENAPPYGSWANGAPMRVSAIGWLRDEKDDVLMLAEKRFHSP